MLTAKRSNFARVFLTFVLLCSFNFTAQAEPSRALKIIATDPVTKQTSEVSLYSKSVAVIIGIDQYVNLPTDKQLTYAVKDAKGIADVLKRQYKFDQIITLYNKDATRKSITKLLEVELPKQLGEQDALFIFWAGHGNQQSSREGDIGYLIPYDGDPNDITANITMTEIRDTISKVIPAKHIFYVMDACYSGLLADTRSVDRAPRRDLAYLQDMTKERVRQVLTAGGKNQEVLDGGANGHSVFTGRLIELLEKTGDFITANEIQAIIKEKVNGDARARSHNQTPTYASLSGSGDFVFIPSLEQKVADNKAEIAKLEAEIKQLDLAALSDRQKREADIAKKSIESKLRAEQLKQELLAAEQRRSEIESAERQKLLAAKSKDDKRLAELKVQADARRKNTPTEQQGKFSTVESAVAEIKRLFIRINAIEAGYEKELAQTRTQVTQRYAIQLDAMDKEQRDEFETVAQLKTRQETQRAELIRSRDAELARLTAAVLGAAETAPLRDSIKALAEREYKMDAESLDVELGQYDTSAQQFTISLHSKTQAIKFAMNGSIPFSPAEAKAFKQQWVSGLVRPEAKGKPGAETATFVLVNDADNTRFIFTEGVFVNEKNSEKSKSASLYRVADGRGDTCYFLIKSWGSWKVSRAGDLNDESVEKVCVTVDSRAIYLAVDRDGRTDRKNKSTSVHDFCVLSLTDTRKNDGYSLCNSAFFSVDWRSAIINVGLPVATYGLALIKGRSFNANGAVDKEKLLEAAQSSGLIAMAEKDRQIAIDARRMAVLEKMASE